MSDQDVRHTRVLESFDDFRDKEIVYGALSATILHVQQPGLLALLVSAREHRVHELKDFYQAQSYRARNDSEN